VQFSASGSDDLFQSISKVRENRSLVVTSNLYYQDLGGCFDYSDLPGIFHGQEREFSTGH